MRSGDREGSNADILLTTWMVAPEDDMIEQNRVLIDQKEFSNILERTGKRTLNDFLQKLAQLA